MTKIDRESTIRDVAEALFAQDPHWATFFREILGLHGAVRRHYPTRDSRAAFEETDTYRELQQMLRKLRERKAVPKDEADQQWEDAKQEPEPEPTQVVTVRIPPLASRGPASRGPRALHQHEQTVHLEAATVYRHGHGPDRESPCDRAAGVNDGEQVGSGPVSRVLCLTGPAEAVR